MYLSARVETHRLLGVPIGLARVQKDALYCMWLEIREVLLTAVNCMDHGVQFAPWCFGAVLCLTRCEEDQAAALSLVFLKGLRHKGQQCSSFCC